MFGSEDLIEAVDEPAATVAHERVRARELIGVAQEQVPGGLGGAATRTRGDLLAVAAGTVVAAMIRHGAFDPLDAVLFPAILVAVAILARIRPGRRWLPPLGLLSALAAWWLVAAVGWGQPEHALPLFGTFIGFGASAVLGAGLADRQLALVWRLLPAGAACFALVGLVGVALRWYPISMQAQGLWRLAGTLTYANAAGLLLAMTLPLALVPEGRGQPGDGGLGDGGRGVRRRGGRGDVVVMLLVAGLVATMSRGAVLALAVVALPLRGRIATRWWPIGLGVGVGVVAVATAASDAAQPALLAAVVIATAVAGGARTASRGVAAVGLAAALATVAMVPSLRDGLADVADRRLSRAEIDDRTPEWGGALDAWRTAPLLGTGPERPFVTRHGGRTELAQFAHSEPLQVAMSAGIVGFALLVGFAWSLYFVLRSRFTAAHAGLVVFAVGGAADFTWHLPALGMVAGVLAAMADREGGGP